MTKKTERLKEYDELIKAYRDLNYKLRVYLRVSTPGVPRKAGYVLLSFLEWCLQRIEEIREEIARS